MKMTSKPVHVLLVEDDRVDAMLVQKGFKRQKIANPIIHAKDGVEALEFLREEGKVPRPFLILLDLNMPRMGGLEFLDEIRKDEILKNAIVFVFTTSNAEKDVWGAYEKNIAGYLLKSGVGEGFLDAINLLDSYWRVVEFPE